MFLTQICFLLLLSVLFERNKCSLFEAYFYIIFYYIQGYLLSCYYFKVVKMRISLFEKKLSFFYHLLYNAQVHVHLLLAYVEWDN